ncbi:hypothetical protein [uncultured Nocardioides sp.]|uniref:hypothetical protein n=1 Tax=uncultured Nocardioides sp. TaxID=198441 RepID=UPI0026137A1F|nr:hypothetical protein [uncultured Nocardioides sp.]
MIAAIVAAEVAFWVFLLGGLTARYVLRLRRPSSVLLVCVPLVDVVLLLVVGVDVARGAEPTRAHALAAVYLGFTVAFGHSVVRWADVRFAHRFADGPAPSSPSKGSPAAVRALWVEWSRVVVASVLACGALLAMVAAGGEPVPTTLDEASTHPYWSTMLLLGLVTAIWFLAGPAFAGRGKAVPSPFQN